MSTRLLRQHGKNIRLSSCNRNGASECVIRVKQTHSGAILIGIDSRSCRLRCHSFPVKPFAKIKRSSASLSQSKAANENKKSFSSLSFKSINFRFICKYERLWR